MTSEQWQQVKGLFEAALERPQPERAAFVTAACPADDEIRAEVLSLLTAHERDPGFMNQPVGNLLADEKLVLHSGQRFGNYEISSPLGKGGMGQVYLALDTRLGRKVALKLLPSSHTYDANHVQRLEHEARAASALNHPNIVTIHEIGEADSIHFMATEFVEGETLRQCISTRTLSVREIVNIGVQVATALRAAHDADIVHRDVKPENIMLRRDGVVKVLDFGLAKLIEGNGDTGIGGREEDDPTAAMSPRLRVSPFRRPELSTPGIVMGTVAYMSPEQARGQLVDARTDVWSLGVVLYEMIAGRAPFVGDTQRAMVDSILHQAPQPLEDRADLPVELTQIISKALTKNANARYESAAEMVNDLGGLKEELEVRARLDREINATDEKVAIASRNTIRQSPANTAGSRQPVRGVKDFVSLVQRHKIFSGGAFILLLGALSWTYFANDPTKPEVATTSRRSIAVLPLEPLATGNRDQVYEVAIADALIQRLSGINGLVVRQLSATRRYTNNPRDPVSAGKEQQVDYVLASTYRLDGRKIHMEAQLMNIGTGQVEAKYPIEDETSDLFALQDRIAKEIENKLGTKFATGSSRHTAKRGTNNQDAYRLYIQGLYLSNAEDGLKALEKAVALDPNYAQAWAGLSYAQHAVTLWRRNASGTHDTYQKSMVALTKALSLDDNLSEAHSGLCENKYLYERDFAGAERECRRAIELDPTSAQAHEIFSRYLMGRGRHAEAIAEIEAAIDLEPASHLIHLNYGRALFYARRYKDAEDQYKRIISMERRDVSVYRWLAWSLALQGKEPEAFEWFKRLLSLRKVDGESFENAFRGEGWRGVVREWVKETDRIDYLGDSDRALYHAQLGDKNKALDLLEKIYQAQALWGTHLHADPRLDPLRDDPRFANLVKRAEGDQ